MTQQLPKPRDSRIGLGAVVAFVVIVLVIAVIIFKLGPCPPGKPVPAGAPATTTGEVIHPAPQAAPGPALVPLK